MLNNEDLLTLSRARMRKIRGDRISMIFQEPMVSLNPAYTIENQLVEALRIHRKISRAEARNRAVEMLASVENPLAGKKDQGLSPPVERRHAAAGHDRRGPFAGSRRSCWPTNPPQPWT